ncbi:uncharacterized protein OGAPODRAFT_17513 [Ogataea polymorpha]|uniref:uncharacterized protein n=1 Tax=Ogataea polymorpha TaxID=460523 RepID=UPI0007F36924|nr:uncharacterized protein OGAPODRAFT_17513 [Ogataea polymorpha]OBA13877.1 hypothetical protein OGAPODRAFT_17513 [Ogataea polymorpha]
MPTSSTPIFFFLPARREEWSPILIPPTSSCNPAFRKSSNSGMAQKVFIHPLPLPLFLPALPGTL